jgi:hypothetical protein
MDQYEYRVCLFDRGALARIAANEPPPLENSLNADAREGWRLVSLTAADEKLIAIYERPVSN